MKKFSILIVDDEPDLLEILKDSLESASYQVLLAHDGQEGLEKARQEKPDLILLDAMLPKKFNKPSPTPNKRLSPLHEVSGYFFPLLKTEICPVKSKENFFA